MIDSLWIPESSIVESVNLNELIVKGRTGEGPFQSTWHSIFQDTRQQGRSKWQKTTDKCIVIIWYAPSLRWSAVQEPPQSGLVALIFLFFFFNWQRIPQLTYSREELLLSRFPPFSLSPFRWHLLPPSSSTAKHGSLCLPTHHLHVVCHHLLAFFLDLKRLS